MSESLKAMRERVHTRIIDNACADQLDELRELQRAAIEAVLAYQHGVPVHHTWGARIDALLEEVEP